MTAAVIERSSSFSGVMDTAVSASICNPEFADGARTGYAELSTFYRRPDAGVWFAAASPRGSSSNPGGEAGLRTDSPSTRHHRGKQRLRLMRAMLIILRPEASSTCGLKLNDSDDLAAGRRPRRQSNHAYSGTGLARRLRREQRNTPSILGYAWAPNNAVTVAAAPIAAPERYDAISEVVVTPRHRNGSRTPKAPALARVTCSLALPLHFRRKCWQQAQG